MSNATPAHEFAALVAVARRQSNMTAAEFDYDLAFGSRASAAFYNAAMHLGTEQYGEFCQAGIEDGKALFEAHLPAIQQMKAAAKTKRYLGWSDAARSMGKRIRYASA